jgi:hypothetical protein
MRKITFEFENIHARAMKGIYKIQLGGKFYIGRAENVYSRVYQHTETINKELMRYPMLKNTQYLKWCQYLLENPSINTLKVVALQRCERDSMLFFAERYYLNQYYGHADCLNLCLAVPRPKCFFGALDKTQVVRKSETSDNWFYIDRDTGEATLTNEPLTVHGKARKRA